MLRFLTALLFAMSLSACGGGDPEDQEPPDVQTPQPPACSASHPTCK